MLGGALSRPHFDDADTGPSRLTEETLLRHDALLGNNPTGANRDDLDFDEDGASAADTGVTGKTFESFASNWSNCDNVSFKKLCM